jgi:hypothetical protein
MIEEIKLPMPHAAQQSIISDTSRFICVNAGRRFGKSDISKTISVIETINSRYTAFVTPTYNLGKHFFEQLYNNLNPKVFSFNRSDLIMKSITGGYLKFFTGERIENMRGHAFHTVILDEAALFKQLKDSYDNIIRPTLTDFQGRCYMMSTPRGKGDFWKFSQNKFKNQEWSTYHFSSYDNPHILHSEIEEARKQLPELVFEQEYMANAQEDIGNPFGIENINKCIVDNYSNRPVFCYGVDLASKLDYTVIIGLDDNGHIVSFERFKADWHEVKRRLAAIEENTPCLVDATGVGMPVVEEAIRENGYIEAFIFTANTKQSLMSQLQVSLQGGDIKIVDNEVAIELRDFEYTYKDGAVKYGAPAGFHDDCVMALALANSIYRERGLGGSDFLY